MIARFGVWVSGHYDNGDSPNKYRYTPLTSPPPTVSVLTQEERESAVHPVPGDPRGGSDQLLLRGGGGSGVFAAIRKNALRLLPQNTQSVGDPWRDVEVRHLWCDRSPWLMQWAEANMRKELEEETRAGIALRPVTFFRLRGANHFVSTMCRECVPVANDTSLIFLCRFTGRSRSGQLMPSWRLPPTILLSSVQNCDGSH